MRINAKLLVSLVALAFAPDHVSAQTTKYTCNQQQQQFTTCIDSITTVVGTSAGGVSIIVHWLGTSGAAGPWSFYQLRYALPGGTDTQVRVAGGSEGVYNLILGPTADPNGIYTFKVQGCNPTPLQPAICGGGSQPPYMWDVENYTISGMPGPTVAGQSGTPPLKPGTSPRDETPVVACTAGAKQVVSPCTCMILSQPSLCDPAETGACLTAAELAKVPKCPGAEYLVCDKLPAIGSRDTGGNWFKTVALNCVRIPVPGAASSNSGTPKKNLPILNQAPTR